jgi:hypothetical protein
MDGALVLHPALILGFVAYCRTIVPIVFISNWDNCSTLNPSSKVGQSPRTQIHFELLKALNRAVDKDRKENAREQSADKEK